MRTVLVIGVGAGDPEQLTVQAVAALNRADVVFAVDKEQDDLGAARRAICDRHIERPYRTARVTDPERGRGPAAVARWRAARAALYEQLIAGLGDAETGAFLAWGDPGFYDSTLGVLDEVTLAFELEVIPGISSVQALAARHRIALNRVGEPLAIAPGRRLADVDVDDVVVMLDTTCAFLAYPEAEIYWGAYLGTPDELLVAGRVADVGEEIRAVRAAARERKGWMFDTYLLRRSARVP